MKKIKIINLILIVVAVIVLLGFFVGFSSAYFTDRKTFEGHGVLPPHTPAVSANINLGGDVWKN